MSETKENNLFFILWIFSDKNMCLTVYVHKWKYLAELYIYLNI